MPRSIEEKALIFAVSEYIYKVIDVTDEGDYYIARVEDPYSVGKYHHVGIRKTQEIQDKIRYAIKDLKWRAAGNEFPTSTSMTTSTAAATGTHGTP